MSETETETHAGTIFSNYKRDTIAIDTLTRPWNIIQGPHPRGIRRRDDEKANEFTAERFSKRICLHQDFSRINACVIDHVRPGMMELTRIVRELRNTREEDPEDDAAQATHAAIYRGSEELKRTYDYNLTRFRNIGKDNNALLSGTELLHPIKWCGKLPRWGNQDIIAFKNG